MQQELISRPFPIGATILSAQVYLGACVLESVFQMQLGGATTWTLFDGLGPGSRIIMRGDALGQVQPFSFPLINVRINAGLFFLQSGLPTGWTFNLWVPNMGIG